MSCPSAGNCTVGGVYLTDDVARVSIAAQRNGGWRTAAELPGIAALNVNGNSDLFSVSCASAANCSAGGYYNNTQGIPEPFVADGGAGNGLRPRSFQASRRSTKAPPTSRSPRSACCRVVRPAIAAPAASTPIRTAASKYSPTRRPVETGQRQARSGAAVRSTQAARLPSPRSRAHHPATAALAGPTRTVHLISTRSSSARPREPGDGARSFPASRPCPPKPRCPNEGRARVARGGGEVVLPPSAGLPRQAYQSADVPCFDRASARAEFRAVSGARWLIRAGVWCLTGRGREAEPAGVGAPRLGLTWAWTGAIRRLAYWHRKAEPGPDRCHTEPGQGRYRKAAPGRRRPGHRASGRNRAALRARRRSPSPRTPLSPSKGIRKSQYSAEHPISGRFMTQNERQRDLASLHHVQGQRDHAGKGAADQGHDRARDSSLRVGANFPHSQPGEKADQDSSVSELSVGRAPIRPTTNAHATATAAPAAIARPMLRGAGAGIKGL